eukprot:TRINITY_DN177_c2_g1_i3.p1 TRINITY_DN177_c2_g1~~TRINITY_DN177_c2_g1_i3.p1  ORF type:complete len:349 (-),score=-22.51 TRINITY_DN177_c2_g1_i3:287-1333(-)
MASQLMISIYNYLSKIEGIPSKHKSLILTKQTLEKIHSRKNIFIKPYTPVILNSTCLTTQAGTLNYKFPFQPQYRTLLSQLHIIHISIYIMLQTNSLFCRDKILTNILTPQINNIYPIKRKQEHDFQRYKTTKIVFFIAYYLELIVPILYDYIQDMEQYNIIQYDTLIVFSIYPFYPRTLITYRTRGTLNTHSHSARTQNFMYINPNPYHHNLLKEEIGILYKIKQNQIKKGQAQRKTPQRAQETTLAPKMECTVVKTCTIYLFKLNTKLKIKKSLVLPQLLQYIYKYNQTHDINQKNVTHITPNFLFVCIHTVDSNYILHLIEEYQPTKVIPETRGQILNFQTYLKI